MSEMPLMKEARLMELKQTWILLTADFVSRCEKRIKSNDAFDVAEVKFLSFLKKLRVICLPRVEIFLVEYMR